MKQAETNLYLCPHDKSKIQCYRLFYNDFISELESGILMKKISKVKYPFSLPDELKGRGTSSPEEIKAAEFIAKHFKEIGLKPFNNSFLKSYVYKKNSNPHDTSVANVKEQTAYNVVGFLDNNARYTIVIGAHFDHLGNGSRS